MGEVELIDEALVGCYNLQNRIATLLAKLIDVQEENRIVPQKVKVFKKKANNKNKKKTFSNALMDASDNNNQKNNNIINKQAESKLSKMFNKLSDSFVEENSDAYSRSFNMNSKYNDSSRYDADDDSSKILAKLNDIMLKVNAENPINSKIKKSRSSRGKKSKGKNKNKNKVSETLTVTSTPISQSLPPSNKMAKSNGSFVSDLPSFMKNSFEIEKLQQQNSCYISDIELSDESDNFDSGLRSLQEINLAYAKIDKRFIEVKRSVESVVVGMKHVDEIINRQKGVFHLNFACAENETFICRH